MSRRVLLMLTQSPFDHSSGAAHSDRTTSTLLASRGFDVRALATTASERLGPFDQEGHLRNLGIDFTVDQPTEHYAPVLDFDYRGVGYRLLQSDKHRPIGWTGELIRQYENELLRTLEEFRPDVVITWGGAPVQRRWRRICRNHGATVCFSMHNFGYIHPEAFHDVDGIFACSKWCADYYHERMGVEATPLPLPLDRDEIIAPDRDPTHLLQINLHQDKGLVFSARLFEELSARRPDIPILAVETRRTEGALYETGDKGGFDLRRHKNLEVIPPVTYAHEFWNRAKVLIAPSVWLEAAGRVAAEAVINGVPPIVSDRGGLGEIAHPAGIVRSVPEEITQQSEVPPGPEAVEPWIEQIIRLWDDKAYFQQRLDLCKEAAERYDPDVIADAFADYFGSVERGPKETRGPGMNTPEARYYQPVETIKLLVVVGQLPQSGSPGMQWLRLLINNLSPYGFDVRVVGTTAAHPALEEPALDFLARRPLQPETHRDVDLDRDVIEVEEAGIPFAILDVGQSDLVSWQREFGDEFLSLVEREAGDFEPDAALCVGVSPLHRDARVRLRARGLRVIQALPDPMYVTPAARGDSDAIIVPGPPLAAACASIGITPTILDLKTDPIVRTTSEGFRTLVGLRPAAH